MHCGIVLFCLPTLNETQLERCFGKHEGKGHYKLFYALEISFQVLHKGLFTSCRFHSPVFANVNDQTIGKFVVGVGKIYKIYFIESTK